MNASRNSLIDVAKGICVIVMIIYHVVEVYSVGSYILHYLLFVAGAFLFLSGFVVANVYPKKYNLAENNGIITKRLVRRSAKIILLFICSNIFIKLITGRDYICNIGTDEIGLALAEVFVYGNYTISSFEVLLPIAYVLLISGSMILFRIFKPFIVITISVLMFAVSCIYFFNLVDGFNFRYITIGIIGAAFGFIPEKVVGRIVSSKYILLLYILYTVVISKVHLYFPFFVLSIILNTGLFFYIGNYTQKVDKLNIYIVSLGQYSLISYMFQIVFVKIFHLFFRQSSACGTGLIILLLCLLNVAIVRIIDRLSKTSERFKKAYNLVLA